MIIDTLTAASTSTEWIDHMVGKVVSYYGLSYRKARPCTITTTRYTYLPTVLYRLPTDGPKDTVIITF